MTVVGIDTETVDPCLSEKRGASWVYGTGKVLCTSLYFEDEDRVSVLKGDGGDTVKGLLTSKDVVLVGANIIYDLGWLCWSLGLGAKEIKATLIDVQIAESHLDEYANVSLETLGQKYLGIGKSKDKIEDWVASQDFYKGGDFRRYLENAPWDMLEVYAAGDAKLPCLVWRKQRRIFEAEQDRYYYKGTYTAYRADGRDLYGNYKNKAFRIYSCPESPLKRVYKGVTYAHVTNYDVRTEWKMRRLTEGNLSSYEKQEILYKGTIYPLFVDFALIPIVLAAKQRGIKIDWALKDKNFAFLSSVHEKLKAGFDAAYGEVNTKSSKQKAAFFDRMGYPYKMRITVKSWNGEAVTFSNIRRVMAECSGCAKGFRAEKGKLVLYIDHEWASRACDMLSERGADIICNPYIDKTVLSEMGEDSRYSACSDMIKINKTKDICDKILGEGYNKFRGSDGRIHADLNIAKGIDSGTKTGRLSSSCPNMQQIPAHGEVALDGGAEEDVIDISKLCRSLFVPDSGFWAHFDYPQIEFRLFAHFAVGRGADELRAKLNADRNLDFHSIVADITGLPRSTAKRITFGTLYGMGAAKLKKDFGYTDSEAEEIFDKYFSNVPCVKSTIQAVSSVFIERGYVTTVAGRHFHLHSENEAYKGINGLDQGSSADMTKRAIVEADDRGLWDILQFYTTVHDEIDFSVPETAEAVKAAEQIADIMSRAYEISVPVFVEPEIGRTWFESSDGSAAERFIKLKEAVNVQ